MLKSSDTITTLGSVSGSPMPESNSPAVIIASTTTAKPKPRPKKTSSQLVLWCRRVRKVPRSFSLKRNSLLWEGSSSDEYESFNNTEETPRQRRQQQNEAGPSSSVGHQNDIVPLAVLYSTRGNAVTIQDAEGQDESTSDKPNLRRQFGSSTLADNSFRTISAGSPSWMFQHQYSPTLPQDQEKVTSTTEKVVRTILLCTTYFSLAMTFSLLGLTLLDLRDHLQMTLTQATQLFTSRSLGGIFGAILMGIVLDHVNDSVAIYLSLLIVSAALYTTPFMTSYEALSFIIFVEGVAISFLQSALSVMCVFIWGSSSAPYMFLLHICYGLGSVVTPLAVEHFLSKSFEDLLNIISDTGNSTRILTHVTHANSSSSPGVSHFGHLNCSAVVEMQELCTFGRRSFEDLCNYFQSLAPTSSLNNNSFFNNSFNHFDINNGISSNIVDLKTITSSPGLQANIFKWNPQNMTSTDGMNNNQSEAWMKRYAKQLADICESMKKEEVHFEDAYFLIASFLSLLGLCYFVLWLVRERNYLIKRVVDHNLLEPDVGRDNSNVNWSLPMVVIIIIYAFFQAGSESAYANYLFTYIIEEFGFSKSASSHVMSVHWTMWLFGYVLGTMAGFHILAVPLIGGGIAIAITFLTLLAFYGNTASILWASVALIGIGQAILTPTLLTWLDTKMFVTHAASSVMMISNNLGAVVISAVSGVILTTDKFYFTVTIAVFYFICLVLFVYIVFIGCCTESVTSPTTIDGNANMAKEADRQSNRLPKRITLRHGSTLYAPHLRPRFSVVSTKDDTSQLQVLRFHCVTIRPSPISLRAVTKFAFNYETDVM